MTNKLSNNARNASHSAPLYTLLYLADNTCADILFAVCKLAKACICPGELDYRALIWLIGYLRRRPYYAIKFYPNATTNPVYDICRQHRIPRGV